MQCERHIKSGPLLEVDFFPVWPSGRKLPTRAPKDKPTAKAQKKYNENQAVKNFVRKINANFDKTDYLLTVTYSPEYAPLCEEAAARDISNYKRRIKTRRASALKKAKKDLKEAEAALLPGAANGFLLESIKNLKKQIKKLSAPFKFAYTTEAVEYKTGPHKGKMNFHFHIFVTGGLPDTVMESVWKRGARCNCDNYQPDRFGPEAAAKYMLKDPKGKRRYSCSKNMTKPKETYRRAGAVSRKKVESMARLRVDDREYWEKRHKGYKFLRAFPRYNEYNGNWYLSVVMYRANGGEPLPKWEYDEWTDNEFIGV